MNAIPTYADLKKHLGHEVRLKYRGPKRDPTMVALECEECEDEAGVLLVLERPPAVGPGFQVRTTRPVEMFFGTPDHLWATREVHIPIDTPEDRVAAVAEQVALADLGKAGVEVAFVGVYFVPDLADLEDVEDEEAE